MTILRIFVVFICGIGAFGCGDSQAPDEARALWDRINSENYRSFSRAPGYETTEPSNAPHGDSVDIYVNDVLQAALDAGEAIESWPEGSLIVKDGFDGDGELELIAVMDKQSDGWFYAEWTDVESGEAKFSGQPAVCVNCHASGADAVQAFGFPGSSQ